MYPYTPNRKVYLDIFPPERVLLIQLYLNLTCNHAIISNRRVCYTFDIIIIILFNYDLLNSRC